jgi:AcrR family transcriptional regulator
MSTTTPRRRKAKGEGHTRREEILEVAKALILTEGLERATVRNIAARLGISATALYLYFPDRDAIMLELCDRAFSHLVVAFSDIAAAGGPALGRLERMMEAYIRFGLNHPNEYRLIFMVKQAVPVQVELDAPDAHVPPGALGVAAFVSLREAVMELVAERTFIGEDPTKLAQLIWMTGHGVVSLLITLPDFPWCDREDLIRAGMRMPLRGFVRQKILD